MSAVDWVVVCEFAGIMLALSGFVIGYALSSHGEWIRSPEGRHLVSFRSSLVAWGLLGVVNNLALDYPGRDVARVAVVGLVLVCALHGCFIMARAQLATRRRLAARESGAQRQQ